MIFGIGTDICDIRRIEQAMQSHGERFAQKILCAAEQKEFHRRRAKVEARGIRYLATRFAAKEAFSKAVGLGMRMPMWWTRCEVVRLAGGRPGIALHDALADWCQARKLIFHLSITDEADTAVAFVIVEIQTEQVS